MNSANQRHMGRTYKRDVKGRFASSGVVRGGTRDAYGKRVSRKDLAAGKRMLREKVTAVAPKFDSPRNMNRRAIAEYRSRLLTAKTPQEKRLLRRTITGMTARLPRLKG